MISARQGIPFTPPLSEATLTCDRICEHDGAMYAVTVSKEPSCLFILFKVCSPHHLRYSTVARPVVINLFHNSLFRSFTLRIYG